MLRVCLVFWKSEPQYAYKRYAYKKTCNGGFFNPLQKKFAIFSLPQSGLQNVLTPLNSRPPPTPGLK